MALKLLGHDPVCNVAVLAEADLSGTFFPTDKCHAKIQAFMRFAAKLPEGQEAVLFIAAGLSDGQGNVIEKSQDGKTVNRFRIEAPAGCRLTVHSAETIFDVLSISLGRQGLRRDPRKELEG
jgi:hypothetical protein